ncbi:uncharacterized protein Dvar_56430 [Desulfosarcina variabilis str. Montpellier]|uniref:hypothetical protein n=1 Tax=Desulfosarcina variabilis TaxID=2300 RepID=UPI003AFAA558
MSFDQLTSKRAESADPYASKNIREANEAVFNHYGVALPGKRGAQQPPVPRNGDELEKGGIIPDRTNKSFLEALDHLEKLVEERSQAPAPKAPTPAPAPRKQPAPRRSGGSPVISLNGMKVQSPAQAAADKRQAAALEAHRCKVRLMCPTERRSMAAGLFREGRKLNEVANIMAGKRLP